MKTTKIWNSQYSILFIQNAILNISFYMTSTVLSKHLVALGMTIAVAGTIIGAMPMASMLVRPISGWICDRFSKKNLLIIFLLINCVSVCGYGLVHSEVIFIILRILHGISFGMTTTITMALITDYIPKGRVGEGLGYFGLTLTLAMAVGPAVGLALVKISGTNVMFYFASACVLLSTVSAFLLKEEEKNEPPEKEKFKLKAVDFFAKEALLFSVIIFALSSVNGIESSYIALFSAQLGIENVGWYFTLSACVLLFSRSFCGRIADKKGLGAVLYPGIIAVTAALVLLSFANQTNSILVLSLAAVLKALGVGAVQPALQAASVQSVESKRRGAAVSTFYVGTDLGQASSPVLAGKLIDTKGYEFMFKLYTIPLMFVCILYGLIRFKKTKQ